MTIYGNRQQIPILRYLKDFKGRPRADCEYPMVYYKQKKIYIDLQVPSVQEEIKRFSTSYTAGRNNHCNPLDHNIASKIFILSFLIKKCIYIVI